VVFRPQCMQVAKEYPPVKTHTPRCVLTMHILPNVVLASHAEGNPRHLRRRTLPSGHVCQNAPERYVHNLLPAKHFHQIRAGKTHTGSLTSRSGKVRNHRLLTHIGQSALSTVTLGFSPWASAALAWLSTTFSHTTQDLVPSL
jgi:hypothetical protein